MPSKSPGAVSPSGLQAQISSVKHRSDVSMDSGVLDSLKRLRGEVTIHSHTNTVFTLRCFFHGQVDAKQADNVRLKASCSGSLQTCCRLTLLALVDAA